MNPIGIAAFLTVIIFLVAMFWFALRKPAAQSALRSIPAFRRLARAIGLSVESGSRLHLSIGSGSLTGLEAGSALAGLSVQERITRTISFSDKPPLVTSGDSTLAILNRDVLIHSQRQAGDINQPDVSLSRLTGLTPFAYAAGAAALIAEEQVSANVLIGHFGSEVALIADAAERQGGVTVGGSDSLTGQAVLYAVSQEPLIGEETYAGAAYLGAGGMHVASLQAQDVLRWGVVVVILGGLLLKLLGLDQFILSLLAGGA